MSWPKKIAVFIVIVLVVNYYRNTNSSKPVPNWDKLVLAIYKAEGGKKTNHPYGVMNLPDNTSPREACLNTLKRRFKTWDGKGDFISYVARTYSPINAPNDPTGLNKHWIKNVNYFYNQKELK